MSYGERRGGYSQRRGDGPRKSQNSGALFVNRNKGKEKHPDYTGDLVLDGALTEVILEQYKRTGEFRIRLSAWKNTSEKAGVWLRILASEDKPREERSGGYNRRSEPSERDDAPWD